MEWLKRVARARDPEAWEPFSVTLARIVGVLALSMGLVTLMFVSIGFLLLRASGG